MRYFFDERGEKQIAWIISMFVIILIVLGGIVWYLVINRQEKEGEKDIAKESEKQVVSQEESGKKRGVKFDFALLQGLSQGHYEAWVTGKDDMQYSLGKFRLGEQGAMVNMEGGSIEEGTFLFPTELSEEKIDTMQAVKVTIEPDNDADSKMSGVVILEGEFSGKKASLAFIAARLANASAKYILATPTNDPEALETSGVWFAIPSLRNEVPSLVLPRVSEGWKYEGWVSYKGVDLSTGRFVQPRGIDEFSGYSGGANAGFGFPGEDFLRNTPEGLVFQFPIDLADGESTVFISIEPDIQGNDPTGNAPFFLQPFTAGIPKGAKDHEVLNLNKDTSKFPTGIAEIL